MVNNENINQLLQDKKDAAARIKNLENEVTTLKVKLATEQGKAMSDDERSELEKVDTILQKYGIALNDLETNVAFAQYAYQTFQKDDPTITNFDKVQSIFDDLLDRPFLQ